MKKRTQQQYGNCFFFSFYMLLRGTGRSLGLTKCDSWLWPAHFVVLTKRGHLVEFRKAFRHEQNTLAPYWFAGHCEGVRKSQIPTSARKPQVVLSSPPAMCTLVAIWLLLVIPWSIGSGLYTAAWSLLWGARAILQRRKGRQ